MEAPPDLNEVIVFARVVAAGSFVGAARVLGMPKSTVSRKVSDLEARLATRLLHRTTRTLSLTEEGRAYFEHAERIVAELERAELAITRRHDVPRGRLRITAPLNFGIIGESIAAFMRRYPEVELEMACTDRVVDLVAEGFDVGIRAGVLQDSSLVARPLTTHRNFVVASPQFIDEHGSPTRPDELARWPCASMPGGASWTLQRGSKTVRVQLRARLVVNDFDVLGAAAVGGVAVALLPAFQCTEHLRHDRLRRVLPEWCSPPVPVNAVYPSARHMSPKVRAFLDHVKDAMDPAPWDRSSPSGATA